MGALEISSTVRHISILTRLIDGFEYMDSGLCRLNYMLALKEYGYFYREDRAYIQTRGFLRVAMPYPMYPAGFCINEFCWPAGDHDRRFYWLKSQLEKCKNKLKEYER
jgi:hypothetical protein